MRAETLVTDPALLARRQDVPAVPDPALDACTVPKLAARLATCRLTRQQAKE
jgi:hypothetical protein